MKITKFKSSLLTTTLISTSLFGSKPNPGTLRLPQETTQEVIQISSKIKIPPSVDKLMQGFNALPNTQAIKQEYENLLKEIRNKQQNQQKGYTITNIQAILNKHIIEYCEAWRKKSIEDFKALTSSDTHYCFKLFLPYLKYYFFQLIDGFESIFAIDTFIETQEFILMDLNEKSINSIINLIKKAENTEIIECIKDIVNILLKDNSSKFISKAYLRSYDLFISNLLEGLKEIGAENTLQMFADTFNSKPTQFLCNIWNNLLEKNITSEQEQKKFFEWINKNKKNLYTQNPLFQEEIDLLCNKVSMEFFKPLKQEHFTKKPIQLLNIWEQFFKQYQEKQEVFLLQNHVYLGNTFVECMTELQTTFNEINIADIDLDELKLFSPLKDILSIFTNNYNEIMKIASLYKNPIYAWNSTQKTIPHILEDINIIKEDTLKLKIFSKENTQEESCTQKESKQKQVSKKNLKSKRKKTKQQKQAPQNGRKAARFTQEIPTQPSQKQMKQAPTPITLKDLDAKFGEDMEKDFDELEVITIDFESEKDWNGFVKENNVEISGTPYQHGSHESQEIFFDFEGQKTKGQLLTYHVHGKDTPEKITRQIRVTRRTQK
ncbi:MAG: hypothetical protein ACLRFH_00005 [Opitutales bacterium]